MKFTPGPWYVFANSRVPHGKQIFSQGWLLCDVYTPGNIPDDLWKQDANAHLIAAAPEMLEALISIVKELKDDEIRLINSNRRGDQSLGSTISWCRTVARTAIHKASEGEQGEL